MPPPQPPDDNLPAGIRLAPRSLGGLEVMRGGKCIGWIHDVGDGKWNAYVPAGPFGGRHAGTYSQAAAVRAILKDGGR